LNDFISFTANNWENNYKTEACNGWVVKAAWTTNSSFRKYCHSIEEVLENLILGCTRFIDVMPYLIVQACMRNKREYKVVVLNKIPRYLAESTSTKGVSFSSDPHDRLFSFAKNAVSELCNVCPYVISDGLIRVDIFQNETGCLIVNEFESMEGNFYGCSNQAMEGENFTNLYLADYYEKMFDNFLNKHA
jgi:hypothetical protein